MHGKKKSDGERGTKFFRDNSFETRQENHLHQFQIAENTKLLDPHETPQHIQLQGFWVSWQALVEVAQVSLLEVLLAHQGAHLGAIFTVAASLLTMSYPPNSVCYQLSVPCKLGDTKGHSKSPTWLHVSECYILAFQYFAILCPKHGPVLTTVLLRFQLLFPGWACSCSCKCTFARPKYFQHRQ